MKQKIADLKALLEKGKSGINSVGVENALTLVNEIEELLPEEEPSDGASSEEV